LIISYEGAGPRRLGQGSLGYRSLGQGSLLTQEPYDIGPSSGEAEGVAAWISP